jgi:hypothetical protein
VASYNNRASVYNTLLSSRQQTSEMPGWLWRVRDATIEQTSQAVFSEGPLGALGDYISEPTKLNPASQLKLGGGQAYDRSSE